jgi:hypothetical protein
MTAAHFFKTTRILTILLLLSPGSSAFSNDFICDPPVQGTRSVWSPASIPKTSASPRV